ncbi:MAG: Aldo/keto reductase [Hydrocarboniphaga sp.]|nr:Aldo/keto reductase [Hydrocarboniphaga sp.]
MGRIGYGAMVLEGYYGPSDDSQAVRTIHRALDLGVSMIDTADFYGNGHNEVLVGSALKGQRDRAFLCTKFGIVSDESESGSELMTGRGFPLKINGSASYAGRALDASLRRLKTDSIDLWYLHYPDPATPIEETVDAMAAAVRAGKVRYLGLSNVSAEQVRRAHAVHPIAAVQYEYSLWRREAERDLLPSLRELGIALVGWSPLGSGFLAGNTDTPQVNDVRNGDPRYSQQNLTVNRDRFAPLSDIAAELGITNAQLALAWLLHQGADIFPIPGTRREERVLENTKAASVHLNAGVLQRIDGLARIGTASGGTLL